MIYSTVTGRIASDVTLRYTPKGDAIASCRVASQGNRRGTDGNMLTTFIPVTLFGKQAENFANLVGKGNAVVINGTIESREFEGKDGLRRTVFEVTAQHWGFQYGNPKNENASEPRPAVAESSGDTPNFTDTPPAFDDPFADE